MTLGKTRDHLLRTTHTPSHPICTLATASTSSPHRSINSWGTCVKGGHHLHLAVGPRRAGKETARAKSESNGGKFACSGWRPGSQRQKWVINTSDLLRAEVHVRLVRTSCGRRSGKIAISFHFTRQVVPRSIRGDPRGETPGGAPDLP